MDEVRFVCDQFANNECCDDDDKGDLDFASLRAAFRDPSNDVIKMPAENFARMREELNRLELATDLQMMKMPSSSK